MLGRTKPLNRLNEPRFRLPLHIRIGALLSRNFRAFYPTYRALIRFKESLRGSLLVFVLLAANAAACYFMLTAGQHVTPPPHEIIRLQVNLHHLNFFIICIIFWVKMMKSHRVYIPRGKITG